MNEKIAGDFEVDYAKSGRSTCKTCRSTISQGTLRLGVLTQSRFFDGLQQSWHHVSCILKKPAAKRLRAAEDIHGFMNLRWKDQELLRGKIGTNIPSATHKPEDPCQVEYAKSNRSKCRACGEVIEARQLRVSFPVESGTSAWHHLDCFFKHYSEKCSTVDDFEGWQLLEKDDLDILRSHIQEGIRTDGSTAKQGTLSKEIASRGKADKTWADESAPEARSSLSTAAAVDEIDGITSVTCIQGGPKEEAELQTKLREQAAAVWAMRDLLSQNIGKRNKSFCIHLLHMNGINVPNSYTMDYLNSILADAMVFGVTELCPECGNSRLIPKEYEYRCPTYEEWGRCTYATDQPKFMKFSVPGDVDDEWLNEYEYVHREKILLKKGGQESAKPTGEVLNPSTDAKRCEAELKEIDTAKPFAQRSISCAGKLSQSQAHYRRLIEGAGGVYVSAITQELTFVVASQKEVKKNSNKIKQAEEMGIDIVDESYISDCIERGKRLNFRDSKYLLVDNNAALVPKKPERRKRKAGSEISERPAKTARVMVKGGAAVDPASHLQDTHHVLNEDDRLWSVVLSRTDVQRGTNSYYKLQLLQADSGQHEYVLFRSWGRIGTAIGGTTKDVGPKDEMKELFCHHYEEKSGNIFGEKPMKMPGKMFPLEVEFADDEDLDTNSAVTPGSKTTLPEQIQRLLKLIFDVHTMKQTLKEMEIDLSKLPLGKISNNMITEAYNVLAEALNVVDSPRRIVGLSNKFFTLVPHDFGSGNAPLLDNEGIIRDKLQMLDTLKDIEIATTLLRKNPNAGVQSDEDPLDVHYRNLKTQLEVIAKESEEYKIVSKCAETTHAPTHSEYSLDVINVFRVERECEAERYMKYSQDIPNKKLLWHGSRVTNYAGILSQGLRIAPKEAPVTGYMFGKGIYFADMVSKSANYCFASASQTTGLLLLSEVALGDEYLRAAADYVTALPEGKHSTKGCGTTGPAEFVPLSDAEPEVLVPMGPPTEQSLPGKTRKSDLLYNEYIVYNTHQARIRYLVEVKFKFKHSR
ncbi:Poly [ADP-ribose] polymerase 1 [Gaertneriomyces sp. JEL0708]|nr:Poly [ADP-ribose] polymerase 1 [Gaertneriomyces sp. JEL0708]